MDSEDFEDNTSQRNENNPVGNSKSPMSKSSTAFLNQLRRCCNCKQSRCVKLYCECFAAGVYCNNTCNCVDCWNNSKYEDHRKAAIKNTLEKNPLAFTPKISTMGNIEPKILEPLNYGKHSKGCACKKSSCMKKYCECFQAQIPCSDLCKCIDCHNTKEYYDANKNQSVGSDIPKQEELTDSNSFFFKFLLAAGETDSPGKPMRLPALNKRLNASLNQEALEKLYERLMRIINLPVDEYLENEEYVREIETYNKEAISIRAGKDSSPQEDRNEGNSQSRKESSTRENAEEEKNGGKKEKGDTEVENDDLICDEEVEELALKPGGPVEKDIKVEKGEEKQMKIEVEKEEKPKANNEMTEREKKLSFYKIKKNRIIREFISVLRELDV